MSLPSFAPISPAPAGSRTAAPAASAPPGPLDRPEAWRGRLRFVRLDTRFGTGQRFLRTWQAWRDDPQRCERLIVVAIDDRPPAPEDLALNHAHSPWSALAQQLAAVWPAPTPDLHLLDFEGGRVQLMLALGTLAEWLPALQLQADAVEIDAGAQTLDADRWNDEALRRLGRLMAPGATVDAPLDPATPGRLAPVGIEPSLPSSPVPTDATTGGRWTGRHAPRFVAPRPRALAHRPDDQPPEARHALIIGAGLAGCAAVHGLALQGWHSTLVDRLEAPAGATSGNAGGLYHAIFNSPDSLHARWFRAAAALTQQLARPWIDAGRVAGQAGRFLRLEPRLDDERAAAQLERAGLPREVVRWWGAGCAARATTLALAHGGWCFGLGGWLSPGDHCRALLAAAQALVPVHWQGGTTIARLAHDGHQWQAFDADDRLVARAPVVVLASALDTPRLLATVQPQQALPLSAVRGQTTLLPADLPGLQAPRWPLSGQGYALRLPDGRVLIGATTRHHDDDPAVREADHRHNLQRAAALGVVPALADGQALPADLGGRVGWRAGTPDRLPLVGPVVDLQALAALRALPRERLHTPAHLPRLPGLHTLTGLGSRGITSAALAGRLLAAWVTGAPMPVEQRLQDALDPARAWMRPAGPAPGSS